MRGPPEAPPTRNTRRFSVDGDDDDDDDDDDDARLDEVDSVGPRSNEGDMDDNGRLYGCGKFMGEGARPKKLAA